MKNIIYNVLIILLVFLLSAFITVFSAGISQGGLSNFGLTKGLGILTTFLLTYGLSYLSIKLTRHRINAKGMLVAISLALIILISMNLVGATIKYTYKVFPHYLSWMLGLIAGYYHVLNGFKTSRLLALIIFPLVMAIGVYNLWFHRIEYGNWTGEVNQETVASFELISKSGDIISNETLKGKYVVFDFWFIGCGPCWGKFPTVQKIYDQYKSRNDFDIYAVNRNDDPEKLFKRIEDKGYTFPVLRGTQEIMDALGIYKYPSVMIINPEGKMIFMGELSDAEIKLEKLLNNSR